MLKAVTDIEAARRGLDLMLKRRLDDRYEDHAYLVKVRNGRIAYATMSSHKVEHDVAPEDLLRTQYEHACELPRRSNGSFTSTKFRSTDIAVCWHVDCSVTGRQDQ
jgi:hypothetical protein